MPAIVQPTRTVMIGCGKFTRHELRAMLALPDRPHIPVVCEPSADAYAQTVPIFHEFGITPPPNQPDLTWLLADYGGELDTAYILTPHAFHHDQATACMEAGLDVLLEKPMVMNVCEAKSLIGVRDRTGRTLVVAVPASLSGHIRAVVAMRERGELGRIRAVSATLWENWALPNTGTWRQRPEISGGGFLFDTGAHVISTIYELVGEEFCTVSARVEQNGWPVETAATIWATTASGVSATIFAFGEAASPAGSRVDAFYTEANINADAWGNPVQIHRRGDSAPQRLAVTAAPSKWAQFLAVRRGELPNPAPAEHGLRLVRLWEAILASAAAGGQPVKI